jgi:hypothetical protein
LEKILMKKNLENQSQIIKKKKEIEKIEEKWKSI